MRSPSFRSAALALLLLAPGAPLPAEATDAFAAARGNDETDMNGTGSAEFAIKAEAREQEWLREHLAAFEQAMSPLSVESIRHRRRRIENGVPACARTTVLRMLALRPSLPLCGNDSSRFAARRYPALSAAALTASLTQWRSKELSKLVSE